MKQSEPEALKSRAIEWSSCLLRFYQRERLGVPIVVQVMREIEMFEVIRRHYEDA